MYQPEFFLPQSIKLEKKKNEATAEVTKTSSNIDAENIITLKIIIKKHTHFASEESMIEKFNTNLKTQVISKEN